LLENKGFKQYVKALLWTSFTMFGPELTAIRNYQTYPN